MEKHNNIFEGLIFVELASVLAGPSVGQFFAELGAQVVKVENPATSGDVTRQWKLGSESKDEHRSAYFSAANWGKRSIGFDLTNPHSREIFYRLVTKADMVVSSYKPGDDQKLGVDYSKLCEYNPDLIYGQISGYGEQNNRTGYDAIVQAETGFMYLNGEATGPSLKMPVALIDVLAAHQLKEALLLALLYKAKSGKGSKVSVSLFDAALSALANQATNYLVARQDPRKLGSAHPNIAPYGELYPCKDGKSILLAIGNDKQFAKLCNILGISRLAYDPMYATNSERVKNRQKLNAILNHAILQFDCNPLWHECQLARIPVGRLNTIRDVFDNEDVSNVLLHDQSHDFGANGIRQYIAKSDMVAKPSHILPPPDLFAHSDQILHEILGLDEKEINQLKYNKLVF